MNETIMKEAGFKHELAEIKSGNCPICYNPVDKTKFRSELDHREFNISGMCQDCQDSIFDGGK